MGTWIEANITLPESVTASDEKENAVSHFIGLFLALIGMLFIAGKTSATGHPMAKTGMIIFEFSSILLYAASGFYHYLGYGIAKRILRVIDHLSIYILIAGSYTPVMLYIGNDSALRYIAGIWSAALIGMILTIRFWGRFYPLHIALYLAMGWSIISVSDKVIPSLPLALFPYIITGGVIYTIGVIFYSFRKLPHHHLIWHIFVLGGSLSFFIGYSLFFLQ